MSLELSQFNLDADRLVKQQSSHVTTCTCASMQSMDLAKLILLYVFQIEGMFAPSSSAAKKTERVPSQAPTIYISYIPTEISELQYTPENLVGGFNPSEKY